MYIYFSGIGGAGIGPLALIAKQAGYDVSGSDKQDSEYIKYLREKGIENITIGQNTDSISKVHEQKPIDWLVFSSSIIKENPDHPELVFARDNGLKATKRDDFLNEILDKSGQKMIAIAGTHGKTTTTAMVIWLFKQLNIPVSYSVGAKLSFGDMGEFDPKAEYFIYEADEYDKNFLSFSPEISIISGIDYDHPDIYPTREDYYQAFKQYISQSNFTVLWEKDYQKLKLTDSTNMKLLPTLASADISLLGQVNRDNAHAAIEALCKLGLTTYNQGEEIMKKFPGISRRFEKIIDNVYTDYAHTPEKIKGAIQLAREISDNLVIVYEGLHNTRQHFIVNELTDLFKEAKSLYVAPSYLAREDESLEMLTPEKLCDIIKIPEECEPVKLDENLKNIITKHAKQNDLVLCLTAGGGGSLDEWLRSAFKS